MSRLSKLEAKVNQLWTPPVFHNVMVSDDTNSGTGKDYTAGVTFLQLEETPYPAGVGGLAVGWDSVYSTTDAFSGSILKKGQVPQALVRPLEVFPGPTHGDYPGTRHNDSIYVSKIRCRIMLKPHWFSAASGWGTATLGTADSVHNPAEIILAWCKFPNVKSLGPFITAEDAPLRDYLVTPISLMFKNLHQQINPGTMHRDFFKWPLSYASQSLPDSYREWHRGMFTSGWYTGETPIDGAVPVPFQVLKEFRYREFPPYKEVSVASSGVNQIGNIGQATTHLSAGGVDAVHSAKQFGESQSTQQQSTNRRWIEFDLPMYRQVDYRPRPQTASTGAFTHSAFGLCEENIQLCVFSNRNSTFWQPQVFCDVLVHGVQE